MSNTAQTTLQLIILGNGFDLHCGLKSSYKDFFRQAILDTIGEGFGLIQKQSGVKGFWEDLLIEIYKTNQRSDYKWCDIETIIKDTLWLIYFGSPDSSTNINHGIWKKALDCVNLRRDIRVEACSTKDPVEQFLFVFCGTYFYRLVAEQQNILPDQEALQRLLDVLLQELHNFEGRFCKYLKENLVKPNDGTEFNQEYVVNSINLLAQITGFTKHECRSIKEIVRPQTQWVTEYQSESVTTHTTKAVDVLAEAFSQLQYSYILSFNYTAFFEILKVESPCHFNNVHGKLCNEECTENCNSSNIIFGIEDSLIQSKGECNDLRLFSKTYRKMFDASVPTSILPPNDFPVEIRLYGHSLSKADYSYFQSIFDYYNLYGNNKVSLIFHYSEGYEQTDEIYNLLNSYGTTLANKDQGKNLIHKLLLENRLKIVLIS